MFFSKKEFERRTCDRVSYRGHCTVISGDTSWSASIINLSEFGALVAIVNPHAFIENDTATLNVQLPDGEAAILQARIAHVKKHYIGMQCEPHTDEDRRRLIRFLNYAGLPLSGYP